MTIPRGQGFKAVYLFGLALFLAEFNLLGSRSGLVANAEAIFDVTEFGAIADGKQESAQAFMKAWNKACHSTEPARLLIPKGTFATSEVFFEGPCTAPRPINIEIQGTILGTTDLSEYVNGVWITIGHVDGVVLSGGGTLNGQGETVWKYKAHGNTGDQLPNSLVFMRVNNSVMQNFNIINSKGFNIKINDCTNITASNLTIKAPGDSPNTDGIHISGSKGVIVTKSDIGVGDDCISIGDGNDGLNISKIFCGPGHGISVGSLGKREGETDTKGIFVTNCTLTNTTNGARIKTYRASPVLAASHIVYDNIVMNDVKNPIIIDQNYDSESKKEPSKVKISDVQFKNIRGTTVSEVPVTLDCSQAFPCEDIKLDNIDLSPATPSVGKLSSVCTNAKLSIVGTLIPAGCN